MSSDHTQGFAYGLTAVLAASIRMEVQPRIGRAQHERVGQRCLYQFCFQCFTQLPSYHFTAEEVQDDCQVQPSFHRGDVSDIADPDLIDSTRLQILYQIGCSALSGHCCARSKRFLASCRQFIFAHQACYAILSTFDPILPQRLPHSWTAVTAFIGCKDSPYLLHQFGLRSLPLTWWSRYGESRSGEDTSELQSRQYHVFRLLLLKKKK